MRPIVLSLLPLLVSVAAGCGDWYRALDQANELRARHSSPLVQWDWELTRSAQVRADQLAASDGCITGSFMPTADETVVSGSVAATCSAAVDKWYHDGDHYTYSSQPYTDNVGSGVQSFDSFTKLLWSSTESMGCASATSDSCGTVIVCKWHTAGNSPTDAAYLANVHPVTDLQQSAGSSSSSITSRRAVLAGEEEGQLSSGEWLEESSIDEESSDEESSLEESSLEESSDDEESSDEESSDEESSEEEEEESCDGEHGGKGAGVEESSMEWGEEESSGDGAEEGSWEEEESSSEEVSGPAVNQQEGSMQFAARKLLRGA